MITYPHDIENKLDFDQIRKLLTGYCQSKRGMTLAQKARPIDEVNILDRRLNQVREMIRLKEHPDRELSYQFPDMDDHLIKVKVPGSFPNPDDFHKLKRGLDVLTLWISFFNKHEKVFPELSGLSSKIEIDDSISKAIDRVINERGEIRDAASSELLEIRFKIVKSERAIRSAIHKILKEAKKDELVDEDSRLTIRDGRLVIPVKTEHKKRIVGFIHDQSATGQTVYLEPNEVLNLNNEVRKLKYTEKREVIRIMVALSDQLRKQLPEIEKGTDLLEKLDFIHAKTKLAELINGIVPTICSNTNIVLSKAIHPVLYLSHQDSGKPIVPLSLTLNHEHRILIISGPNSGGKSVALKTVGLLQYMVQCGLPVSVGEGSSFGIFSSIFIDIGDTQSIENDLSTYSSHLISMNYFLRFSNEKSLFLIDEFGKGTEPQFGGAIAESVLHQLNEKKTVGIVTTHYQNLKKAGNEFPGLINGAMKYNLEVLEPLFELEIGIPGSSFAFEIARKIGLPTEIIDSAKKKIGSSQVDYDQLLNDLEKEKGKYDKLLKKLEKEQEEFSKTKEDYENIRATLETGKKRIIKEAKREAKQILNQANRDIERVIRAIKESQASKQQTAKARKELEIKKEKLSDENKPVKSFLKKGDVVTVIDQDMSGIIQKINGKKAEILFGSLKLIIPKDRLEKKTIPPQVRYQKKVKKLGIDISNKIANFSHELNIRGIRVDEAISKVEAFLDEALLVGADEVMILHGKGHGILRSIVRNISKNHPRVASIEDEHADRGGAGISIIKLQ